MRMVIATHNAHKLCELSRILEPLGIETVTAALSEVEETGATFAENAHLKAAAACRETGLPAIGDDSGLMVEALDGAPGVFSARYAGPGATDADRNQKLLHALREVPAGRRDAKFVCAVCCVFPNGHTVCAEGECRGEIGFAADGRDGFGYDPLFVVGNTTFARLTAAEKDAVSHRGNALRQFYAALKKEMEKKEHANQ